MINWNRFLSALLAIGYLIAGFVLGGPVLLFKAIIFLIMPMACIWYSDYLGDIVGPGTSFLTGGPAFTEETPGCVVVLGSSRDNIQTVARNLRLF
jgi:hypothetical protein